MTNLLDHGVEDARHLLVVVQLVGLQDATQCLKCLLFVVQLLPSTLLDQALYNLQIQNDPL